MEPYKGQLQLSCDGLNNHGAIANALDYLKNSIADSTTGSLDEKEFSELGVQIALSKILSADYVPRMVFGNFEMQCLVGSGSFGKIWKAKFKPGDVMPVDVAVKQLNASILDTPALWKERDLLIMLKHERVCNIIGAFMEIDAFIVMELCYGSISKLKYRTDKRNAIRFAVHLLEAVAWLHSKNIVHADIKADNCLINQSNNLVLSDFGSAFILHHDKEKIFVPFAHGSPGYLDLEANQDHYFSKRTDIFSVACVLFEMDVRRHLLLYQNQDHTHELYADALQNGRVIGLPANTLPTEDMPRENLQTRAYQSFFVHLIHKMIAQPESRLTARTALLDETLRVLMTSESIIDLSQEKEEAQDFVTREFTMDKKKTFKRFFGEDGFKNPGLLTFYYDEALAAPAQNRRSRDVKQADKSPSDSTSSDSESSYEPPVMKRRCLS